jgi:DNA-binding transcriptional regulator YhcF (GntR family)
LLSLTVSRNGGLPLRDQIVPASNGESMIGTFCPGTKLPSIRNFAETYNVSRFTVVEAYDRLVRWASAAIARPPSTIVQPYLSP